MKLHVTSAKLLNNRQMLVLTNVGEIIVTTKADELTDTERSEAKMRAMIDGRSLAEARAEVAGEFYDFAFTANN